MKIGGKNGLTRNQFRVLISNLQEIAHELNNAKQEHEKVEKQEEGKKDED